MIYFQLCTEFCCRYAVDTQSLTNNHTRLLECLCIGNKFYITVGVDNVNLKLNSLHARKIVSKENIYKGL